MKNTQLETLSVQKYLHEHIPLSAAMGVAVVNCGMNKVILSAPLQPNINHRETVFGGSASALAILSAWTLLYVRMKLELLKSRIVIQENSVAYLKPIRGEFLAVCTFSDTERWLRFKKHFEKKNRARITLNSMLEYNNEQVGSFEGKFVALGY